MALKKPSDLLGIQKVTEIVEQINTIDETLSDNNLKDSSPSPNFAVSFSASLIDEIFKDLQEKIEKSHKEDILQVYEELSRCKKLISVTDLKVESRLSSFKKDLYEKIDEHIIHAQQTIQELYQSEIRQIRKLSSDVNLVEKYINNHSQDIVRLRQEIFTELKKNPVIIERLEYKIQEVSKSYQTLSEGLLNEPPSDNGDPLSADTNFVTLDQLKDHYRLFLNRIEEQLSTLGGGGETKLKYLDDIVGIATNASAYDANFLRYNHIEGKFEFVDNTSYWVKTSVGIHTLSNVGIGTTNTIHPFIVVGSATSNTFCITSDGDVGIGTTNPEAFTLWNTLTLDSHKKSGNTIGGGDIVLKSAGEYFFDLFCTQTIPNSNSGFSSATYLGIFRPFEIYGFNNATNTRQVLNLDNVDVGIGTTNPKGSIHVRSGPVIVGTVGAGASTGTLNQNLQITGGAYISGNAGIGSTSPTARLDVQGGDVKVGLNTSTGIVLTSPNGTSYRLIVDDSGNLSTTLA